MHSLALNQWGQVFSWGSDYHGQLGQNIGEDIQSIPKIIRALALYNIVQICCGHRHSVALANSMAKYMFASSFWITSSIFSGWNIGMGSKSFWSVGSRSYFPNWIYSKSYNEFKGRSNWIYRLRIKSYFHHFKIWSSLWLGWVYKLLQ